MGTDGRDEASSDADASTVVGVVGLGYVGLPLAIAMAESGFRTIGFDLSEEIVAALQAGRSHILDVPALTPVVGDDREHGRPHRERSPRIRWESEQLV